MSFIYLDNNATTRPAPAVVAAMQPYFTDFYFNPSGGYGPSDQLMADMEKARAQVAILVGARPDEIVFTSCATESNNTAIRSALESRPDRRHLVTMAVEHDCVLNTCRYWETQGARITVLPVDSRGQMDLDQLAQALTPDTALLSVMYANNETGIIFPVERIGAMAREKGVPFHCDAVQAAGKVQVDLSSFHPDFLSLSAHKFHGPRGAGILYVRRGIRLRPLLYGGNQEKGRRSGTENVPAIVGMGVAAELARAHLGEMGERVRALRDKLEAGVRQEIPEVLINGEGTERLPHTSNVSFYHVSGRAALQLLEEFGILAAGGSACGTEANAPPSHVLEALQVPELAIRGTLRFSLSRYTTKEEIDRVLEVLPDVIARVRTTAVMGGIS